MGEARRPCPFCERPVGGVHADECPRSRHRIARAKRMERIGRQIARGNFIWISTTLAEGPQLNPPRPARHRVVSVPNSMEVRLEPILYKVRVNGTRRRGQRDPKYPHGTVVQALIETIQAAQRDEEAENAAPGS